MPIPSLISDLSTTAASNSPAGSESPVDGDNYLRAHASFIAQLNDEKAPKASPTFTGTVTAANLTATGNTLIGSVGTDGLSNLQIKDTSGTCIRLTSSDTNSADKQGHISVAQYLTSSPAYQIVGGTATSTANYVDIGGNNSAYAAASGIRFWTGAVSATGGGATEKLQITEDGRLYGTALHNNSGAVTGTTNQYIASGTYTPTGTAGTNCDSVTPAGAQWMRVGNVVTVSGRVAVDPTANSTRTVWTLTLPIASNFTSTAQLNGIVAAANTGATNAGTVIGETTLDEAQFVIESQAGSSLTYHYHYTYAVA